MNRTLCTILISSAVLSYAADEALPKAEAVMDRYVEVTGGKEAYAKRKSETQMGTLEFAAMGLKAKIVRYAAEPDKYVTSMEIPGMGKVDSGVTDGIAWDNSAVLGPRIKSGEEKALAVREANFNAVVNWRKLYPKTETLGVESVNGEDCYKIQASPAEGHSQTMFFSKDSGLLLKVTMIAATQMGEVPVEMYYTTYKTANGVKYPSSFSQKAAGQEFTVTIDSVTVNEEIPAEKFALPAEIKALRDKQK
jgi:hypothetical protein